MVLNTAKLAIAAQQKSLSVTGHNIANVNSPYYSRQSAVHSPRDPVPYGEYWLGSGVDVDAILRSADQLLENRLIDLKSDLASSEEMATYMNIFETSINENSESGISNLMAEFWNSWQGLSNNPTGSPERIAVYEKGVETAERFDALTNDLLQMETDLNSEVSAILSEIGSLSEQIAELNNELIGQESTNVSYDMLDSRNGLVTELAKLIGINTFEQPDGALSVTTAGGFNLVNSAESLSLTFDAGRVYWEGSFGSKVDITDRIESGEIHGWLEMRDEVIAKSQTELDGLAKEFIWAANYQHSQGVGMDYFDSAVTGTYATDGSGMLATLAYGDKIDYTEDFKMWIEDATGSPATYSAVTVDMGLSTANPAYTALDTFNEANSTYTITIVSGGVAGADNIQFEWSDTAGGGSGTVNMNAPATTVTIDGMDLTFAAGDTLVAGNTLKINTDATGEDTAVSLTPTGTANSILDTYKFSVTTGGTVGTDTIVVDWANSVTTGSFTLTATTTTATVDGMTLTFAAGGRFATDDAFNITTGSTGSPTANMMSDWHWTMDSFAGRFNDLATGVAASVGSSNELTFTPAAGYSFGFSDDEFTDCGLTAALGINTFFSGYDCQTIAVNSTLVDKDSIAAAKIDATDGTFGVGDNSNALDIADLKFSTRSIAEWTYERGSDAQSHETEFTLEDYYRSMISSISVKSANVNRSVTFHEAMVDRLGEQRDNLSAVSLDEEMINMMKYQHAFTVASKLLSVADELLTTLINAK